MDLGRLVNTALNRFGLHLSRSAERRLGSGLLSPDLARRTEMKRDPLAFPANDLRRQFLRNSTQDLHKWHHYFEIYDQWFSRFRNRTGLRVLEIGVFRGGSLRMWRDYFDPDAIIVGVDINPDCKAREDRDRKIFVEIGDQTDTAFLRRVVDSFGPFDIIIDDGGHTTAQQIISFNCLYGMGLNDGGVYLVEDLHSNYWPAFLDSDCSFVDFAKSLTDRLHEPYVTNHSEPRFREGSGEQQQSVSVSVFCANTHAIAFYDSVIVFDKRRRSMPISEIR